VADITPDDIYHEHIVDKIPIITTVASCTASQYNCRYFSITVNDSIGQSFPCGMDCILDSCWFILRRNVSDEIANAYVRAKMYVGTEEALGSGIYKPTGDPIATSNPVFVGELFEYPSESRINFNFTGTNRIMLNYEGWYVVTVQGEGVGYGYKSELDYVSAKYATTKTCATGNSCSFDPVSSKWVTSPSADTFFLVRGVELPFDTIFPANIIHHHTVTATTINVIVGI
jgi:hypothetical protein